MSKSHKKIFRNKRAIIDIPLTELIYLVVAVGIILLLVYFSFSLFSLFSEGKEHESTINNLKVLSSNIRSLIQEDSKFNYKTMPYYISDKRILVGFNYVDESKDMYTECSGENIVNSRPNLCEDKSCLCIYKDNGFTRVNDNWIPLIFLYKKKNSDFDDKLYSPLECEVFEDKIVFLATLDKNDKSFGGSRSGWDPVFYDNNGYEFLVIYGNECSDGSKFKVKNIYIEKYNEGEDNFIFISKYVDDPEDPIYKRKEFLTNKYDLD